MVTTKVFTPLEKYTQSRDAAEFAEVVSAAEIQAARAAAAAEQDRRRAEFTSETLADPPGRAALAAADAELGVAIVAALKVHAAAFDAHNARIADLSGMCRMLDLVNLDAPIVVKTNCAQSGLWIQGLPVHREHGWTTRVQKVFGSAVFTSKHSTR